MLCGSRMDWTAARRERRYLSCKFGGGGGEHFLVMANDVPFIAIYAFFFFLQVVVCSDISPHNIIKFPHQTLIARRFPQNPVLSPIPPQSSTPILSFLFLIFTSSSRFLFFIFFSTLLEIKGGKPLESDRVWIDMRQGGFRILGA